MLEHRIVPFHPFEYHMLVAPDEDTLVSFVPGHGSLLQLRWKGRDLLESEPDGDHLKLNRWAKGNLLFPFPNRLNEGKFHWDGKAYQFPINDAGTNNALHGFFGQMSFQLESKTIDSHRASLVFVHRPDSIPENYPFEYELKVELELDLENGFWITTSVQNLGGDPMPTSWGWHPYFKLPGKLEDWELKLPKCKMVGVDQRMLPTGKLYDYESFNEGKRVGAIILDNCFSLDKPEGLIEISLCSGREKMVYLQDHGPGQYPFFQLFIPPDRKSIAIEPMTSNVDALNNQDGLIILKGNEIAKAGWGIKYLLEVD